MSVLKRTIYRTLAARKTDLKNVKATEMGSHEPTAGNILRLPNGQETKDSAQGAHVIYSNICHEAVLPPRKRSKLPERGFRLSLRT